MDGVVSMPRMLSPSARVAMKHVAETVVDNNWRVRGKLEARGRVTVDVSLSEAGAQRLLMATKQPKLGLLQLHNLFRSRK